MCRVTTQYGGYGYFDCQCAAEGSTQQPAMPAMTLIDTVNEVGFAWWAVNVAAGQTVQYNVSDHGKGPVSKTLIGPANVTGPFRALPNAPGEGFIFSFAFNATSPVADTHEDKEQEHEWLGGADTTGMTGGWLPCRSTDPVTVQVPKSPTTGGNTVALSWSAPALLYGPLERLVYDVLLRNDTTKSDFVEVARNIAGGQLDVSLPAVQRKCDAYTVRLQTTGILLNGTRGPTCLEHYNDVDVFLRGSPAQPSGLQVDYTTLTARSVNASWTPSIDDGGCPMFYTLSLMDGNSNLSASRYRRRREMDACYRGAVMVSMTGGYLIDEIPFVEAVKPTDWYDETPVENWCDEKYVAKKRWLSQKG